MPDSVLITAAPPTPNGDLHLGHLSGPYSGADIFARAHRLVGNEALYLTGSDLHQSCVPYRAWKSGTDAHELASDYAQEIQDIFARTAFTVDVYSRPWTSQHHARFVTEFITHLYQQGKLRTQTTECLYCHKCDRYLFEAYVRGGCPHCQAESDGNYCELCAWPNAVTDLTDPRCLCCGSSPVRRTYTPLVFPLSDYADELAKFCEQTELSPQLLALARGMLDKGLPDIPVSHRTDWGIPVPIPGFENQCVDVWVEMVPGYFAALQESCDARGRGEDWRTAWTTAAQIVQFFGFDNGYFHTVLFPALSRAYDTGLRLPDALITNEFYNLGEQKFSTSRHHAIWADTLLSHVPTDVVRFVLAHDRPESESTSFGWQRLHTLSDELVRNWQPWLSALWAHAQARFGPRVPVVEENLVRRDALAPQLARIAEDTLHAYSIDGFSPQRAARQLKELVRLARQHWAAHQRTLDWRAESDDATRVLTVQLLASKTLAQLAAPLMPEFAQRLWHSLGYRSEPYWDGLALPPAGQTLTAVPIFFEPLPVDLETVVFGS